MLTKKVNSQCSITSAYEKNYSIYIDSFSVLLGIPYCCLTEHESASSRRKLLIPAAAHGIYALQHSQGVLVLNSKNSNNFEVLLVGT